MAEKSASMPSAPAAAPAGDYPELPPSYDETMGAGNIF